MVSLFRKLSMKLAGDNKKSKAEPSFVLSDGGATKPGFLLKEDLSIGKELHPVPVLSPSSEDSPPSDFHYISANCVTSQIQIDNRITSLNWCDCVDDCSTGNCHCIKWGTGGGNPFYQDGRLSPETDYNWPPVIYECNPACTCNAGKCGNRVVQNGAPFAFQLIKTPNRGWGLRTLDFIPKGSFITEYVGEIISRENGDYREDDTYYFALQPNGPGPRTGGYLIDSRFYGNISRYCNHSCEPNAIAIKVFTDVQDPQFPKICFFAARDIEVGEELTIDYGERYWVVRYRRNGTLCLCGTPSCHYAANTIEATVADWDRRAAEAEKAAAEKAQAEEAAQAAAEAPEETQAKDEGEEEDEEMEEDEASDSSEEDEEESSGETGDESSASENEDEESEEDMQASTLASSSADEEAKAME